MIAAGGGAIVNTASQWRLHPAPNHIGCNVTSTASPVSRPKQRAPEHPRERRLPGEVFTPVLEDGVRRSGRTMADLDALVPFGRVGKPENIAARVGFLASDEAPFMCGSLVEITGAQAVG